jgi:Ni/Co efflux regulator RcnB
MIFLAASALVPASALTAQTTVQPPVKWEDTPDARLKVPATPAPAGAAPAPGVSWQQPPAAAAPQVRTQVAPAPRPMPQVRAQAVPAPRPAAPVAQGRIAPAPQSAPARHVEVRRHAAAPHGQPQGPVRVEMHHPQGQAPLAHSGHPDMQRNIIIRRDGHRMERRHHGINRYPHYRRFDRGLTVPQYWWGPRFHVMNWGAYGLPQPIHGGRWVRYYDDALMIDGHGRIHDGRWDMDWDRYDDQWDYDDRGIPIYGGDGGYYPDDRDYEWAERRRGYGEYGYGHRQQAYGYPGYGYGYGHGGMVVTETTVTTGPTVIEKTIFEEVVQSSPRRSYRSKGRRIGSKTRCVC